VLKRLYESPYLVCWGFMREFGTKAPPTQKLFSSKNFSAGKRFLAIGRPIIESRVRFIQA